MEDEVELADVFETPVEGLDKDLQCARPALVSRIGLNSVRRKVTYLNQIEDTELALALVDDKDEVQGRVMAIDDAQVVVARVVLLARLAESEPGRQVDKVAERVVSDRYERVDPLEDGGAGFG